MQKMTEQEKIDLKNQIETLNSDDKQDEIETNEKEMKLFWEKRKMEACVWGVCITASNTCYQIMNVWNPKTQEERSCNSIYMIGSAMSIISFTLYFKKNFDTIYLTILYIAFRNTSRLLDFE